MTTDYDALILSRPIRNQDEPTQVDVWCARAVIVITELQAEVERLKANRYTEAWREATARAERAEAERDALQAKVDALMLEYCPQEMEKAQWAKWEAAQRVKDTP